METGLLPVELYRLKVKDIDLDHRTVNPITVKRGNARTLPISTQLATNIRTYIIKHNLNPQDKLFDVTAENYAKAYRQMRNRGFSSLAPNKVLTLKYELYSSWRDAR
jgi:integrase